MTPYYQRGNCTVYHAKCQDVIGVVELPVIRLLLSDPPYLGLSYALQVALGLKAWNQDEEGAWMANLYGWYAEWIPLCRLVVEAARGRACLFASPHHLPMIARVATIAGWSPQGFWFAPHAEALISFGMPFSWADRDRIGDAFDASSHPPHIDDDVLDAIVACYGGGVVLDPFMGQGGSLLSAMRAGQPCIGIEMDEAQCAIAAAKIDAWFDAQSNTHPDLTGNLSR